eukprot:EC813827.1.p5 GENE.EC813827.1~~EC813827.1.p5  ORF type:complete len:68 (+),score=10.26 EC813827.1:357-560(+)
MCVCVFVCVRISRFCGVLSLASLPFVCNRTVDLSLSLSRLMMSSFSFVAALSVRVCGTFAIDASACA